MTTLQQMLAASESGDVSLVRSLLDEGAAVDAADHEGATPLQTAAANGREEIARLLLMRGAALDRANAYGWSALMQAARAGHHPVVALLLQHKADADRRNLLGASALALAARGGHVSVVRLLLDAGADPDPCGAACEFTALVAAATHGADPVARLLLDRGGGDAAHRMLSTGASALMAAAQNGHMTTCQLLVERGCDANATDVCERTALDLARERHCKEVQGYLERKTTHRPKKDKKDTKPDIIDSAKAGDLKTVVRILDNDPLQVNCVDKDGATALMFAAMLGKQDIVELLVQRGADVNKQDKVSHWTALMQAVYHG
ncbi:PREDICTED: ankyrin repeat and SAM domain-containing protein 6-like [Priapulus caudatus]|uniref:Ankyrin repeat and SAM domain-containing protein 6-like n=1 Tax=Priapulus caudatus TaxID=37621 RepID=A0ABM1F2L6_PRICU|nr:PREDICTED: ankyrin repeat and SAM domain-containing protein 6-like [Priapulus caudatus]